MFWNWNFILKETHHVLADEKRLGCGVHIRKWLRKPLENISQAMKNVVDIINWTVKPCIVKLCLTTELLKIVIYY